MEGSERGAKVLLEMTEWQGRGTREEGQRYGLRQNSQGAQETEVLIDLD